MVNVEDSDASARDCAASEDEFEAGIGALVSGP
jgi:hypothetical protein